MRARARGAELVVLETMPGHLRGSHRAAGNWGTYPHNGSQRHLCDRATAEDVVREDHDSYARIVRVATGTDAALERYTVE